MRTTARSGLVALLLLGVATASQAGNGHLCCACIEDQKATVSAYSPLFPGEAFFCGEIATPQLPADLQRCDGLGGIIACEQSGPVECPTVLSEAGVICPGNFGAPLASASGLVALAGLLAGAGIFAVRRRS